MYMYFNNNNNVYYNIKKYLYILLYTSIYMYVFSYTFWKKKMNFWSIYRLYKSVHQSTHP